MERLAEGRKCEWVEVGPVSPPYAPMESATGKAVRKLLYDRAETLGTMAASRQITVDLVPQRASTNAKLLAMFDRTKTGGRLTIQKISPPDPSHSLVKPCVGPHAIRQYASTSGGSRLPANNPRKLAKHAPAGGIHVAVMPFFKWSGRFSLFGVPAPAFLGPRVDPRVDPLVDPRVDRLVDLRVDLYLRVDPLVDAIVGPRVG